ncbi:PhoH family protein [Thiomicrospira sp. ALE5]|uniref:PhoH family protein n=1 Tax=Thiomicrospira sp. ALE5 TaxID=748650 RepID=UPI0008DF7D9A|nr:PhoH family protein [Thiomicrospira sp. ALE5]SFR53816.1 phosphate starvation-inducible protein PhoH [Thiomicrospira sp. ALE5]
MSESQLDSIVFELTPESNEQLQNFCGWHNQHISDLELKLGVEINHLGFKFKITGHPSRLVTAERAVRTWYAEAEHKTLLPEDLHLLLSSADIQQGLAQAAASSTEGFELIRVKRKQIKTRNPNQTQYVRAMKNNEVNFGIGPAGTGKTYLAVACAVAALEADQVRRIVLTRPAVEAGEKLGFLPGDLTQKVDPYLRPLYDALFDMLGFEAVERLIEKNVIEIAPLAFMRGRTLNEAFIILDEAQNTTIEQMKMLLTRMGFNSRLAVTGDITQCDLPKHQKSGLRDAIEVLADLDEIGFTFFQVKDVVRHKLVQRIVQAYEQSKPMPHN